MNFKSFYILLEAKSDIVSMGFPEIIAEIFYEKFGNLAFLLAKWFRDYKYSGEDRPNNWWFLSTSSLREKYTLFTLTYLYSATKDEEQYRAALDKFEISQNEFVDLEEQRIALKEQIERKLLSESFFEFNPFIKDIISGKISDLAPYKKLDFDSAYIKYDKKNIFKDRQPLRIYSNGYKWIDVGQRCNLVGKLMKNCGSAGIMGWDVDRTLLTLFDRHNKPHVVITYSPNEKRLSSEEGIASSEIKSKYHDYVLDLANFLGAKFDVLRSKSNALRIKYLLSGIAQDLREVPSIKNSWNSYYQFSVEGKKYYTDGNLVVSEEDIQKINWKSIPLRSDEKNVIQNTFSYLNQSILASYGIQYTPIQKFIGNPLYQ